MSHRKYCHNLLWLYCDQRAFFPSVPTVIVISHGSTSCSSRCLLHHHFMESLPFPTTKSSLYSLILCSFYLNYNLRRRFSNSCFPLSDPLSLSLSLPSAHVVKSTCSVCIAHALDHGFNYVNSAKLVTLPYHRGLLFQFFKCTDCVLFIGK